MSYSGTGDIINRWNGTRRITVGAGTFMITTNVIEAMIIKADAIIDVYTSNIYGTTGFGTNVYGTKSVPPIIKSISEDLAAAYCIDGLVIPVEDELLSYGTRLEERAMGLLEKISAGELPLLGYNPEETAIPQGGDYDFTVYDEVVSLSGTELVNLAWRKVVPYSEDVKINVLDGTTEYVRDTDYKMYYFNDRTSGTNFGKIRRLATGSITNNQQVKISYNVYKEHVFGIVDRQAMGQVDSNVGIGQVLP